MSIRLTVKTANVGRDVPATQTRANMARVRNRPLAGTMRRDPQAVLWQELDDADAAPERDILTDLFPAGRYTTWPGAHSPGCLVPVTLPAPWHITYHHATKVSDGKAKISPDRYVTVVKATHPNLTDPVAFVSFQLVAGAFTNPGQSDEAYRLWAWNAGFAGAKSLVHDLALQGVTVIGGCDANNPHMPDIHPRARVAIHRSLDYLWFVPGSTDVRVRGTGVIPLNIDGHNALWARLDLSSKE